MYRVCTGSQLQCRVLRLAASTLLLCAAGLALRAAHADAPRARWPETPQVLYKDLFRAVQTSGIYADSKLFPDALPRARPQEILAQYAAQPPRSTGQLQGFVQERFILPPEAPVPPPFVPQTIAAHIDGLWDALTRRTPAVPRYSSQLAVPQPYIVPGGRFREMYYWDSYFTLLGLGPSGRSDLMQAMVENFAYLIDTYGHVPNGTRTYYLSRSQPPLFFEMVRLLTPDDPDESLAHFLPQLRREYAFWMQGAERINPGQAHRRVVAMPDGSVLNRYWDDRDLPRDEAYAEDTQLARGSTRSPRQIYRDLRAAAESGWDFSSRWLADGDTRGSIITTQIIPVDLNSLLLGLEQAIRAACARKAQTACVREFARRAARRQAAINRYLWDPAPGVYYDYRWTKRVPVRRLSAATFYPLFEGGASDAQARAVATAASQALLEPGGLVTTTLTTGEQWDAPNGWAPLQWIAVAGLRRYHRASLAETIACRWMLTVNGLYERTGKLVEKYDVISGKSGRGGEYPTQDGFGWTNGVTRKLMVLYPADAALADVAQCPLPRPDP
jgi:alpha,alpha-trehalase